MRHRPLLPATALSLALTSCAVPFAGTAPGSNQAAPASVVAPAGPATGAAAKAPAPAGPSLAPAPPLAEDARLRLQGTVTFNDQPVTAATLTAVDLATGVAIPLTAWAETPGAGATGTQRTDAKGAFDLELPKLADGQLVKLVAVSGSQTYTALFDARGRAVGAAGAQGASYRLAQGKAISITIRLRLTAGSTAAAKAFEGALKLTFQLPDATREAERLTALAAAEQAAKDVEAALAAKPALAQDLVVSVGADGEVEDLDQFRSAVAKLGVFDRVFEAVKERLVAVTAQQLTADGQLTPITAEDFPLDRVTITRAGGFTFTGGSAGVLGGAVTSNFVPTAERTRRRAPAPAPGGPGGGGAPSVVNSNPNNDRPGARFLVQNEWMYGLAVRAGGGLLVRKVTGGGLNTPIQAYSMLGVPEGQALHDSGFEFCLAAHPTDDDVVYGVLNNTPANGNPVVSHLDTRATAALTPALPDRTGVGYFGLATGRTRAYVAAGGAAVIRWFDLADPSATGSVVTPGLVTDFAVHDDGVAPPTLILPFVRSQSPIQTDIVAVQEDGASRTIAALPSGQFTLHTGVAIASPSIFVGGLMDGQGTPLNRVYRIDVNTGQLTTLVSRTTDASGTFQLPDSQIGFTWGLAASADGKTLYWVTEEIPQSQSMNLIRFVLP